MIRVNEVIELDVIYLDMDGVIANFNKRYKELFGMTAEELKKTKDRVKYKENWETFVRGKEFETLECFDHTHVLRCVMEKIPYCRKCILSSSGGYSLHEEIESQKNTWLFNNQFSMPSIIVPGRQYKKDYAHPAALIIDDTESVVNDFVDAGGNAILFTTIEDTIEKLVSLLPEDFLDLDSIYEEVSMM